MATRKKLEIDSTPVLVQSAIEDGAGKNIQDNYAKQDGYYQGLTAGLSDNFNSRITLQDKSPYLFRPTGGSLEVGNKCYLKSVIGGTVIFNQLVDTDTTTITLVNGHKYFTNISSQKSVVSGAGNDVSVTGSTDCVIDLTQMFGSSIANYIYSLEQSSAGTGVAWFQKFFPKDHYGYDAGSLISVKTTGKKIVGFNAYNNATGTAKLLGGYEYQITGTYTSVSYTDINGNLETLTIDADGKFTPANNGVLTVVGGNSTDTCVHLVWDGERDWEFEEFKETTYPIENVELRGVPKLDGNNNLYYDGDEYKSDGTVVRKYALVDLGTLTWNKSSSGNQPFYTTGLENMIVKNTDNSRTYTNLICQKNYIKTNVSTLVYGSNISSSISVDINGDLWIYDTAYTSNTAAEFKTAMSGVYLVYALRNPTTETATAFTEAQIVNNFGTESYIDSRSIPLIVGHNTEYLPDLKAKVEVAPESPDGDGYYVMKRDGGLNSYVEMLSLLLPKLPSDSANGTYVLKAIKSGDIITYSWVTE